LGGLWRSVATALQQRCRLLPIRTGISEIFRKYFEFLGQSSSISEMLFVLGEGKREFINQIIKGKKKKTPPEKRNYR